MSEIPVNEFARRYLEDLLSFFGLNTRVEDKLNEGVVELNVPTSALNGFLIGQHGQNLRSIQYLLNLVTRQAGYEETTVVIDIAGYRRQQAERLTKRIVGIIDEVKASGEERKLEPMSAADRRVVHQAVTEADGVESASAGEGRDRAVVIRKSS